MADGGAAPMPKRRDDDKEDASGADATSASSGLLPSDTVGADADARMRCDFFATGPGAHLCQDPSVVKDDSGGRGVDGSGGGGVTVVNSDRTLDTDLLDINMPSSPSDDDCRKKRCVDRYDSSESSDSGVAILSCTDCSGSSTASSDIADPGSPFSTASSHSEDSGSQPAKMPPTQTAHHPPWSWTDEQPTLKRQTASTTAFTSQAKRLKTSSAAVGETTTTPPKCLNNNVTSKTNAQQTQALVAEGAAKKLEAAKLQQGKITEYFRSQCKPTIIKKELSNVIIKSSSAAAKYMNLVEKKGARSVPQGKVQIDRLHKPHRTVPRKILPAPTKHPDKIINVSPITNFPPIITTLIPNVAYIQAKAPKPPDNIFMPQFAINENAIPIVNRIIQPVQKLTTINNFNCVKLNAAVVPIVKLNMPPKTTTTTSYIPASQPAPAAAAFSMLGAGLPTVLAAKPKDGVPMSLPQEALVQPATPVLSLSPSPTTMTSMTSDSSDIVADEAGRCLVEEMSPADSGVSSTASLLEVQIDDDIKLADVEEQQKSPILSQPKTIRFPAKELHEPKEKISVSTDTASCQWDQCGTHFDTNGALLDHLQVKHVISQANKEQFVCLWQGCKVHGRKSCSRSWLERHVLAHAGSKPFRCIVDGCGQRFNSQTALERHVNGHFNADSSQNGSTKKSIENGCSKLFRRNGKKIRFRRQPWSARMFDFMDSGIMEGLQYKLVAMTENRTLGQFASAEGDTITLQSQILARRVEQDGSAQMLVRWHPANVTDDEWVNEKEYKATKTICIPKLEAAQKESLVPALFSNGHHHHQQQPQLQRRHRTKHRRKPCSKLT